MQVTVSNRTSSGEHKVKLVSLMLSDTTNAIRESPGGSHCTAGVNLEVWDGSIVNDQPVL